MLVYGMPSPIHLIVCRLVAVVTVTILDAQLGSVATDLCGGSTA
jgi:hypothetical protein